MGVASGCGEQMVSVASGSGWNLWVWLLGVVVRKYSYRFLHTTYPYSSYTCSFLQQHPYFLFIFLKVFRSLLCFSSERNSVTVFFTFTLSTQGTIIAILLKTEILYKNNPLRETQLYYFPSPLSINFLELFNYYIPLTTFL